MERDTQSGGRKDALHRASASENQEHGDDTALQRSFKMDAPKVKGRRKGISPVTHHFYHSGSGVGRMDAEGRNTEAHHLPLLQAYGGDHVADPRRRPLHGEQDTRTP